MAQLCWSNTIFWRLHLTQPNIPSLLCFLNLPHWHQIIVMHSFLSKHLVLDYQLLYSEFALSILYIGGTFCYYSWLCSFRQRPFQALFCKHSDSNNFFSHDFVESFYLPLRLNQYDFFWSSITVKIILKIKIVHYRN